MQNQYEALGEILKNTRSKAYITVESLANRIGVAERFLYRIENEGKKPSYLFCLLLSNHFGMEHVILRFNTTKPTTKRIGKIVAASSPIFRFPPAISEKFPIIAGLTVAPKSPASAKKANIAVPPFGHFGEERRIVPGHICSCAIK